MVHILHSTRNRESLLNAGVVYGATHFSKKKGLREAYPLVGATVVNDFYDDDDNCCPRFGDPIELTSSMLQLLCDEEWLLCKPEEGAVRTEGRYDVHTLFLIPSNEDDVADVQGFWSWQWRCRDMGMYDLLGVYMPDDIHDALQQQLDSLPYADHLHVYILADEIRLRPLAGQPGSCRCGNIASPVCDHLLCSNCCNGCARHGTAASQPAQPRPGQPGSCSCGNIASPACDHLLCSNCCQGCSRHGTAEPARPQPGQPGSCSSIASPACDHLLCSNCCNGCSRHRSSQFVEPVQPVRPTIVLGGGLRVLPHAAVAAAGSSSSTAMGNGATSSAAAAGWGLAGPSTSSGALGTMSGLAEAAGRLSAEEQLHQATHCVVCLDGLRDTLLLPCKHMVLCQGCLWRMQQLAQQEAGSSSNVRALCPVCRVPVASQMPGIIMS